MFTRGLRFVWLIALVGISILFLAAPSAFAKGPADKIIITGPGLSKPIEITEDEALERFSPWDDKFIDYSRGNIEKPTQVEPMFQVQMIVNDESGKPTWVYTLQYVPDRSGEGGYIYLPGPGEEHYKNNAFTILRRVDGSWLSASDAFDTLMRQALEANGVSLAPSAFSSVTKLLSDASWLIALGMIALLGATALVFHRRVPRGSI